MRHISFNVYTSNYFSIILEFDYMDKKYDKALLSFESDIKQRGVIDWIIAHTSFFKPLHRYEGELSLFSDRIYFKGHDRKEGRSFSIEINKKQVMEIFYGFDNIFRRGEDRALGIGFQPLRIKMGKNGSVDSIYLIIGYRRALRTSKNKEWYKILKEWSNLS